MLLQLVNQDLGYDRGLVLHDISLDIHAGDRIALVGRNGSGKSTLLRIAAGLTDPSGGDVVTEKNATIRYLPQVSHWVQQEAPEAVNAMIRAWIEGRHVPQAGLGGRLLIADS